MPVKRTKKLIRKMKGGLGVFRHTKQQPQQPPQYSNINFTKENNYTPFEDPYGNPTYETFMGRRNSGSNPGRKSLRNPGSNSGRNSGRNPGSNSGSISRRTSRRTSRRNSGRKSLRNSGSNSGRNSGNGTSVNFESQLNVMTSFGTRLDSKPSQSKQQKQQKPQLPPKPSGLARRQ